MHEGGQEDKSRGRKQKSHVFLTLLKKLTRENSPKLYKNLIIKLFEGLEIVIWWRSTKNTKMEKKTEKVFYFATSEKVNKRIKFKICQIKRLNYVKEGLD